MADVKLKTLTPADISVLQGVIDREKGRPSGGTGRPRPEYDDGSAPECYVALTPVGGIPALVPGPTAHVIRQGSHGRQVYAATDDEPGVAWCDIYQIIRDEVDNRLQAVPKLAVQVWNLSGVAVVEDAWVLVTRDKFGRWVAGQSVGGGETGFWAHVFQWDCTQGQYYIVEVVPADFGTWQTRDGGVATEWAYHAQKANFSGGPLVADYTVVWVRKGKLRTSDSVQEYVFDCPSGFTGVSETVGRWRCVNGVPEVLPYYTEHWNGQVIRQPSHLSSVPPCDPWTPPPP